MDTGEGYPRDIDSNLNPEIKESSLIAPDVKRVPKAETYDRSYWTPERISINIASFFKGLEQNEQRMRAENQRLLEQSFKGKEAREMAEKAIAEKKTAEVEEQRRTGLKKELEETEAQRELRYTIEWMIEQSYEVKDLAITFLNSAGVQDQAQDEDK